MTADYSCADEPNGSGIESCVGDVPDGDELDTSTLGEHTFTVEATDRAGNTGSQTVNYRVVDTTAPGIVVTTPASGAVYGLGEHVVADYACADEAGGSGVATCAGTVADGAAIDTSSVGEKTFTVEATDNAGNPASKSVKYTVVDTAGAGIVVTTPASGAVYGLGEHVVADYSCADEAGGSGVASCVGTVANGAAVDTSSVGEKTFTVEATDNAGNPTSKSVKYTVVDQAPPSISVASPTEGAVYALGQRVLASYACEDQPGGSGVASCSGHRGERRADRHGELRRAHLRGHELRQRGEPRDQGRHLQRRLQLRRLPVAGQEPAEGEQVEGRRAGADPLLAERLPAGRSRRPTAIRARRAAAAATPR